MSINILEFTSLLFRFAFSVSGFMLAYVFFQKVKQAKGSGMDLSVFLGIGVFMLFGGIMELFTIYFAYHFYELGQKFYFFYATHYFFGNIAMLGLVYYSEKMLNTKYVFTIFTIISVTVGLVFFRTVDSLVLYSTSTMPISVIIFYINFFYSLVIKMKGEIRKRMIRGFLSGVGIFAFFIMQTDFEQDFLPIPAEWSVIIGSIGIVISCTLLAIIFLSFETFTEFEWREKMKELFIIAENGASIHHYSFSEKTSSPHPDLITAGLIGVKDILMEMIKSETPLEVADHQDLKIIFKYGSYSTIVLITDENLRIYHSKLALLIERFENLFQDVLPHWGGNLEVFIPTKQLVEEIFS